MKRAARGIRVGLPGLASLAAGCAGHYDEPSTGAYILGGLFILIGVILAYELMRNS